VHICHRDVQEIAACLGHWKMAISKKKNKKKKQQQQQKTTTNKQTIRQTD